MTGPRTITTSSWRTRPGGAWRRPGCRRVWRASPGCTRWSRSTPRRTGPICRRRTSPAGWVTALRAAGYQVFAINPLSSARYRERYSTSGAKSDAGDAHVLAEIVRLDRAHHRQIAGDSDLADAVKLLARAHQTAVWERTRHQLRLRSALNEFFPVAVQAFPDLTGLDSLILLGRAPDP